MSPDDRRAAALVALLGGAGTMHFLRPAFFDAIVPEWMPGSKRTTTYVSGAVELVGAVLVALPRTRRLGGWWSAATMLGVFPANVQAALDGGMPDAPPPFDTAAAAWARLPLQVPMVVLALRVAREG